MVQFHRVLPTALLVLSILMCSNGSMFHQWSLTSAKIAYFLSTSVVNGCFVLKPIYIYLTYLACDLYLYTTCVCVLYVSAHDVYIYIYLYVCVCVYVCMYVCTHVFMYVFMFVCMCVCVYIRVYLCVHIYICFICVCLKYIYLTSNERLNIIVNISEFRAWLGYKIMDTFTHIPRYTSFYTRELDCQKR